MTRLFAPLAASLAVLIAALALALPARAAGNLIRTFVSSAGNDSNPCTVAAPCASFAVAYAAVAPSGIVAALDPGKYGPLTINSSVTIDGNGWAAITAPAGGSGITVNAGSSDKVILRGLAIDETTGGSASSGITVNSGGSLTVTGCTVRNMSFGDGLDVFNNGSSPKTLTVTDSHFINNGPGQNGSGVFLNTGISGTSSGTITASFVRTEFAGSNYGLRLAGNSAATIDAAVTDSVAVNNGLFGFLATGPANLSLTDDQVVGNGTGVVATNGATLWLAQSTVTGNGVGYLIQSGTIESFDDNYFADNGTSTGNLTLVGKQ